jgi:hypothetical protein
MNVVLHSILSIVAILAIVVGIIVAIVTFIITFKISNFFIAPREHWRQSRFAIIVLKLSMAAGAAYWAFIITISLFAGMR